MKRCTYCGKEYPDDASVCAIDGQSLQPGIPPSSPPPVRERQCIVDDEHMKLLSIFHFVVGGLALLGIGFLLVHYLFMSSMFSNPDLWKSHKNSTPPPKELLKVFVWFYIFMGAVLMTACVLNFLSGLFLRQRRHRTFSMVVGGLNCIQIPFGTLLGIFTIMVLSRDSVRAQYSG